MRPPRVRLIDTMELLSDLHADSLELLLIDTMDRATLRQHVINAAVIVRRMMPGKSDAAEEARLLVVAETPVSRET